MGQVHRQPGRDPWGGYVAVTLSAARTLDGASAKHQRLNPNGANRNVDLPAEETNKGRDFVICNTGTSGNLVVRDDAAATISTLSPGEQGTFTCNGTNWLGEVTIFNASGGAQPYIAGVQMLATAAEIDAVADVSTRLVNTTATTLTITQALHAGKIVKISSTSPIAITLPAASGSGDIYKFVVDVAATATAHTIKVANASDVMAGAAIVAQADATQVGGFLTAATDDTISLNGTTKGGLVGQRVEIIDVASNRFHVLLLGGATGTVATPFSATV